MKDFYDCIVAGGGPAGATTAALIAMEGKSVLLLEREAFPRFHIGESLMPESFWVLKRLGVLEEMQQFVVKLSVQFVNHNGRESQPFFFFDHDPRDCSRTWQVERAKFDQMLFQNAAKKGADCFDRTRVLEVQFESPGGAGAAPETLRARGVRLETADGAMREVGCRVFVDATGQQALLANRLGIKEEDPQYKKAAIWGYYRRARREPGENSGATIILHTKSKRSWFWFIPLADDVTSIGVVGDNDYLLKERGKPASVFEDELVQCPRLAERLLNAELASKFHVAKEFSYMTRKHAGEGWVLVGDAFGFIDPIYSSGVFLALRSGELAADAIVDALNKNDLSAASLGRWASEFKLGVAWIRKLIDAFYTPAFSFGSFMRQHPKHRGNLTDLLIGRVFSEEAGEIFHDLSPMLAASSEEDATDNPARSAQPAPPSAPCPEASGEA